jgi:hypothetical protein
MPERQHTLQSGGLQLLVVIQTCQGARVTEDSRVAQGLIMTRGGKAGVSKLGRGLPGVFAMRLGAAGLQRTRSVALPDLEAHPCPAPSACGPHCSTQRKKKEFVAGAPLAEDQHPVQALATHGANQTLRIRSHGALKPCP